MRNLIRISLLAAIVGLATPAFADFGTTDLGINSRITNNATFTSNTGSPVKLANHDNVGFAFRFQGDQAGTGAITLTFARSVDGTNWETTPRFTWSVALNGNTAVVAYTNFPSAVIGAAGYLKVAQIANADANATATNASLTLIRKSLK